MKFRSKQPPRTVRRSPSGNPTAKYYRSEKSAASPFRKTGTPPRQSRWRGRVLDVVILTTIIGLAIYSLIINPTPKVTVNDESYHSAKAYEVATKPVLAQPSNRTKLTLNEKQVSDYLKKQFPEIKTVRISAPLISQQPHITIEVGQPVIKLDSSGESYVISEDGVVIGPANRFRNSDSLPILTDESGFTISPGRPVLQSSSVAFILSLRAQLAKAKIPVDSMTLPSQPQELNLRTADRDYLVKFFLGGKAAGQTGQYLAARKQFDKEGTKPSEYLDVRVAGKAFYK